MARCMGSGAINCRRRLAASVTQAEGCEEFMNGSKIDDIDGVDLA